MGDGLLVTASSLSRLPSSMGGDLWLSLVMTWVRLGAGTAIGTTVLLAVILAGHAGTFDPAPALLFAVVVGSAVGGRRGGVSAAAVASLAAVLYYAQPAWVGTPGNAIRVVFVVATAALTVAIVGSLRQTADHLRGRVGNRRGLTDAVQAFASAVGEARDEALLDTIVARGRELVSAEFVVLTVLDPRSGRHVVRAVDGTPSSAVGVEVLPGVGITGQAIRDRRLVMTANPWTGTSGQPTRQRISDLMPSNYVRRTGRRSSDVFSADVTAAGGTASPARSLASLPALNGGRVAATLTVGRAGGRPAFSDHERLALELVAPTIALTIGNWLLRRQLREASLRDSLSGLYNRAYLDAALEQLLALRSRISPPERKPLSLILFDLDEFRGFNDQHGRKTGDAVIRAIGGLLRNRFRASDLLARTSGDGFLVVLDGADLDVAGRAAAEIRASVNALALADDRGVRVAVSISAGCATFGDDAERSDAVIRSVEAALDTARWSGAGAIVSI
jgi:diguanylate cyclase (GGDEF)-like protein